MNAKGGGCAAAAKATPRRRVKFAPLTFAAGAALVLALSASATVASVVLVARALTVTDGGGRGDFAAWLDSVAARERAVQRHEWRRYALQQSTRPRDDVPPPWSAAWPRAPSTAVISAERFDLAARGAADDGNGDDTASSSSSLVATAAKAVTPADAHVAGTNLPRMPPRHRRVYYVYDAADYARAWNVTVPEARHCAARARAPLSILLDALRMHGGNNAGNDSDNADSANIAAGTDADADARSVRTTRKPARANVLLVDDAYMTRMARCFGATAPAASNALRRAYAHLPHARQPGAHVRVSVRDDDGERVANDDDDNEEAALDDIARRAPVWRVPLVPHRWASREFVPTSRLPITLAVLGDNGDKSDVAATHARRSLRGQLGEVYDADSNADDDDDDVDAADIGTGADAAILDWFTYSVTPRLLGLDAHVALVTGGGGGGGDDSSLRHMRARRFALRNLLNTSTHSAFCMAAPSPLVPRAVGGALLVQAMSVGCVPVFASSTDTWPHAASPAIDWHRFAVTLDDTGARDAQEPSLALVQRLRAMSTHEIHRRRVLARRAYLRHFDVPGAEHLDDATLAHATRLLPMLF